MSEILEKCRSVVVVNSESQTLKLSMDLQKRNRGEQFAAFAGTGAGGYFYIHGNDALVPNTVLECVMSKGGDSVSALYKGHPIFENKGELMKVREKLIKELAHKIGLPPESVGIDDSVRGRTIGLEDVSTGQLIDMLLDKSFSLVGVSDTHMIDHTTAPLEVAQAQTGKMSMSEFERSENDHINTGKSGAVVIG